MWLIVFLFQSYNNYKRRLKVITRVSKTVKARAKGHELEFEEMRAGIRGDARSICVHKGGVCV